MSVTTTANPVTLSLQQTLGDYEVHVTGDSQEARPVASQNSRQSNTVANPPSWPRNYHRVPPHRPVNRDLDWSQRPLGANPGEKLFLNVMFTGVSSNAVSKIDNTPYILVLTLRRAWHSFGERREGRCLRRLSSTPLGANGDLNRDDLLGWSCFGLFAGNFIWNCVCDEI